MALAGQAPVIAPTRYEALARQHYENFPVGSVFVPRKVRPHMRRIYAFARTADDLADELRDAQALQAFREDFRAHLQARAATPVPLFVDLVATIRQFALPEQLFFDLLDAFAQDLVVLRHDEHSLFDYCRRSADPVGRLVLRLFGHDDARLDGWSDQICTGLQLLNHLQDIRADLCERERIYLPLEDLARFGVAQDDLRQPPASPAVRALVQHWTDRTAAMFAAGWPLTEAVHGRLRLELRAILAGAGAVLRRIRAAEHDVLSAPLRLSRRQKIGALGRALFGRRIPPVFLRASVPVW